MRGWIGALQSRPVDLEVDGLSVLQVQRPGRGCLSYVIASGGDALVVDPAPDAELLRRARGRARRDGHRCRRHAPARRPSLRRPRAGRADRRPPAPAGGGARARRGLHLLPAARRRHDPHRCRHRPRPGPPRPHHRHDRAADRRPCAAQRRLAVRRRDRPARPPAGRPRGRPCDGAHSARHAARPRPHPRRRRRSCCPATPIRASTPTRSPRIWRPSAQPCPSWRSTIAGEFAETLLAEMPPRPANYETVIAVNAGTHPFDPELETGGNSCSTR